MAYSIVFKEDSNSVIPQFKEAKEDFNTNLLNYIITQNAASHANLSDRNLENQHPISAITNLSTILKELQSQILVGSSEYWNTQINFVPNKGQIIIYLDDDNTNLKIGDGNAYVVDLPYLSNNITTQLLAHVADTDSHTTAEEKARWNNKLNYSIEDNSETLVLNRL